MRFVHLTLEPPKVRVTQEEILADLRYPAASVRTKDAKSTQKRP